MVSLTKEEILNAMNDVSFSIGGITTYHDKPMANSLFYGSELFSNSDINFNYQIYGVMVELRIFSYLEDSFLDLINDSEIDFTDIKNRIFINPADSNKFSNKQIVKYIRNAVAHSDTTKELFKISRNGRFVEIDLKNTNPIPFHVKIDSKDLEKMIMTLSSLSKNRYCTYIDRTGYKLYRIYYKEKIDPKIIYEDMVRQSYIYDYDLAYEKLIEYFKDNNIDYEIKEYTLNHEQTKLIGKYRKESKKIIKKFTNGKEASDSFFSEFVSSIIPLAPEKIETLKNHLHIVSMITRFPQYSFDDICNYISCLYLDEQDKVPLEFASFYRYLFQDNVSKTNLQRMANGYFMRNEVAIEILSYYFSCYNDESEIEVDSKRINKENLRDALVHGRWFDDFDGNIVCCDTRNGKNNDYNFYWTNSINLPNLFEYYKNTFLYKTR